MPCVLLDRSTELASTVRNRDKARQKSAEDSDSERGNQVQAVIFGMMPQRDTFANLFPATWMKLGICGILCPAGTQPHLLLQHHALGPAAGLLALIHQNWQGFYDGYDRRSRVERTRVIFTRTACLRSLVY